MEAVADVAKLALKSQTIFGAFHFLFFLISWPFVIGFLKDYQDKDRLTFNCIPKPSDFIRQRCYNSYYSVMSPLMLTPLDLAGITWGALSVLWVIFTIMCARALLQIKTAAGNGEREKWSKRFFQRFICHIFIQFAVLGVMMGLFCGYQTIHFPAEYTCSQTNTTMTSFNPVAVNITCNDLRYKEKAKLNIAIIVIMAISIACCVLTVIHLHLRVRKKERYYDKIRQLKFLGNIFDADVGDDNVATISLVETGRVSSDGERSTEHRADASNSSFIIDKVRQIYESCEKRLLPLPWLGGTSFLLENIFTRLKIVSKEKLRGILLTDEVINNMTGIFKAHEGCRKPRIVLIEGEPGMGKTTYSRKLAYDWATKKDKWDASFPKIDVLLFLRCRNIKSSIREAIDEYILPKDISENDREMFFKFIQENQSKVLYVFDGLDEVDPEKLETIFYDIFQSKQLSACNIVFTSRHEVGRKVRRYCDTLWEIVGFTKEDAESFIRKYFKTNEHSAEELIEKLWPEQPGDQWDPLGALDELTKNPLNTALICVLFENCKGALPSNRTQLYTEFVYCVLRRYEIKKGLLSSDDLISTVYRKDLSDLGRLALESLRNDELYFQKQENYFKSSVFIEFGFLSIDSGSSVRNPSLRCGFFHKSFQEFFAGLYLAFQILDREVECDSVVKDERYVEELNQAFLFMIGIIASQNKEIAVSLLSTMIEHINSLNTNEEKHLDIKENYVQLVCKCVSKYSNCDLKLQSVLNLGKHIDLSSMYRLEFWGSRIIDDNSTAFLSEALKANSSVYNYFFRYNSIGDNGAFYVSQTLASSKTLRRMDLMRNGISAKGASFLSEGLKKNSSLTCFVMDYNSIGDDGACSISQALAVNSYLTHLNLRHNGIGDDGAYGLSQALKKNSSLAHLDLSQNSISADGAFFLSEALEANSSLTSLDLEDNKVGDKGASSLSRALTKNKSLTYLDLGCNIIGDKGARFFSHALTADSYLTKLVLERNSIGLDGIDVLSKALEANASLTFLDLRDNFIGVRSASLLSVALKANSSLSTLALHGNGIGADGAFFLSKALAVNSSLAVLYLPSNSIGDDGASSLADALKKNSSLNELYLDNNSIGVRGASSLSKALQANSSLTKLVLKSNSIGDDGASSLSQALTSKSSSLTNLDLSGNNIGDGGASSLSRALKANSSLTNLDLSDNNIGPVAAEALKINKTVNVKGL